MEDRRRFLRTDTHTHTHTKKYFYQICCTNLLKSVSAADWRHNERLILNYQIKTVAISMCRIDIANLLGSFLYNQQHTCFSIPIL